MAKTNKTTLTSILNSKKKAHVKLAAIIEVVARARKAYGNADIEIDPAEVNTTEGKTEIIYLTDADKVAAARREINTIRVKAIESTKVTEGVILDREIEKLIAVNPILTNLESTSGSDYI